MQVSLAFRPFHPRLARFYPARLQARRILHIQARTERSICRKSPESTLPGPTSTKIVTPRFDHFMYRVEPPHRLRHLPDQRLTRLIPSRNRLRIHIRDHGNSQCVEFRRAQIRLQAAAAPAPSARNGTAPKPATSPRVSLRSAKQFPLPASQPPRSPKSPFAPVNSSSQVKPRCGLPLFCRYQLLRRERSPRIAAIAPSPTGTASCIYFPRLRAIFTASAKVQSARRHNRGVFPRLCPAAKSGNDPRSPAPDTPQSKPSKSPVACFQFASALLPSL